MDELKELILERQKELNETWGELYKSKCDSPFYHCNKSWVDSDLNDLQTRQNELSIVLELIKACEE